MGIYKRPVAPLLRGSTFSSKRWRVFSPVVYRYIDRRFADAFFEDGSLRLTELRKVPEAQ
jgi:hypothetical protein